MLFISLKIRVEGTLCDTILFTKREGGKQKTAVQKLPLYKTNSFLNNNLNQQKL